MRRLLAAFLAVGALWGFAHGFASLGDGPCHGGWRDHASHHAGEHP
jgi:hypothetical protein